MDVYCYMPISTGSHPLVYLNPSAPDKSAILHKTHNSDCFLLCAFVAIMVIIATIA